LEGTRNDTPSDINPNQRNDEPKPNKTKSEEKRNQQREKPKDILGEESTSTNRRSGWGGGLTQTTQPIIT
jgi:hypothetical protein